MRSRSPSRDRGRALALALALVIAPLAVARADDASDQAAFAAATQRLADGDRAGARAALEALAAASPTGRWADDALAEAAAIAEQDGDLAGARALWQRVVDEHGDGRLARRAAARLTALAAAGGTDGRWDAVAAGHDRLVRAATAADDPHAALAELGALLDGNRGYPRWFDAALWLGEAWARIGERGLAATWLDRALAVATGSRQRFRAALARAELLADAGDHDGAARLLRSLGDLDRLDARARDQALAELATRRFRARVGLAAWIALALGALGVVALLRRRTGTWRGAARTLWPPPLEVIYLVPVAAVLVVVAERGNALAARAVESILAGAIAITWLHGAVLRSRPGRLGTVALTLHVAALCAAVAAVAWIAIVHDQLLDLLLETWRSGHDAR